MKARPSKRVAFTSLPLTRKDEEEGGKGEVGEDLLKEEREEKGEQHGDSPSSSPTPTPRCHFTFWNELVIGMSVIFYIADLCLDLWVCGEHFMTCQSKSAWFIFFCILLPNLYAGYKSLQWYLRAHEQTPIRRPAKWIIRVVFFPISPILRYIDAWKYGRRARLHWENRNFAMEYRNFEKYMMEIAEVALLRLVIIFLEDAPIVVLNLALLLESPPAAYVADHALVMTTPEPNHHPCYEKMSETDPQTVRIVRLSSVVAKLACTMTLGVVHYISSNKRAWHIANSQGKQLGQDTEKGKLKDAMHVARGKDSERRGVLTFPAELAVYCWQLLSIGSRVVTYALFWVVHFDWLWLPITIRWFIHSVWIYFDVAEMSLVNSIAFGGVYLFSYITTAPGRQILRIVLYYILTFGEAIIIALLWHFGAMNNYYHDIGLGVMFGGAGGGLIFMTLYYNCCHPDKDQVWIRHWWRERKEQRERSEQMELE